jgi:polysaccharide pyruvyl transferase
MARPLRVGVLTFHRCINYGSYWQARCLVEGLRALGTDAVLLDHNSRRVNWLEWRCALQPLLPVRTPRSDVRLYASKTRRFLRALEGLPRSARFPLDEPSGSEAYDVVVVGSDEVWNLTHPWYGGSEIFYGVGLKAPRLVSYAASFGNFGAATGLKRQWSDRLRRFKLISVRDVNSADLIRDTLGQSVQVVLDPCIQFPPQRCFSPSEQTEPYLAVYGHSFPSWFRHAAKKWAVCMGYRVLSIGYRNVWADEQHLDACPETFSRLMAGSAAVATNFFHGCVFALLNGKPFVCVSSEYRHNKLRGLASALGADKHLVEETAGPWRIGELLSAPLDHTIFDRIAEMQQRSSAYLSAAIG